jgi:hypothetical protein
MVAGSFTRSQSRSIILRNVEEGMKNPAMTPTAKAKKRIDLSPRFSQFAKRNARRRLRRVSVAAR